MATWFVTWRPRDVGASTACVTLVAPRGLPTTPSLGGQLEGLHIAAEGFAERRFQQRAFHVPHPCGRRRRPFEVDNRERGIESGWQREDKMLAVGAEQTRTRPIRRPQPDFELHRDAFGAWVRDVALNGEAVADAAISAAGQGHRDRRGTGAFALNWIVPKSAGTIPSQCCSKLAAKLITSPLDP